MIEEQPKPNWNPLPRTGCTNVDFRVLLGKEGIMIANLRFQANGTIDKHSAPYDIDVICISGSGYTSVGDETSQLQSGQTVRWPANSDHCLWTKEDEMETLMLERHAT